MPMLPPVTMTTLSANRMVSPPSFFSRDADAGSLLALPAVVIRIVFERPHLGVHGDVAPPALGAPLARLPVLAPHGALGLAFEVLVPLAEVVAVPGHLRAQARQPELLPDLPGALHVLALGQGDRRRRPLAHDV